MGGACGCRELEFEGERFPLGMARGRVCGVHSWTMQLCDLHSCELSIQPHSYRHTGEFGDSGYQPPKVIPTRRGST